MKIKMVSLVCLFLCLIAHPAGAAKKVGEVIWRDLDEGKALVYVAREWAFGASVRTTFLFSDEQLIATLDTGTYAAVYVPAGKHILMWGLSQWETHTLCEVTLEAGKEYYFLLKLNRRKLLLMDREAGRAMVNAVGNLVEPTEEERRTAEELIQELMEWRIYAWDPAMVANLVDGLGERLIEVKPRALESIDAMIGQYLFSFSIPQGSLGHVIVRAELSDLASGYSIKEGNLEEASFLLRAAISGYATAGERFEVLRRRARSAKWKRVLAFSLLAVLNPSVVDGIGNELVPIGGLQQLQQRKHLRQAEDAEILRLESERRLACIERGEGSESVLNCIDKYEGSP